MRQYCQAQIDRNRTDEERHAAKRAHNRDTDEQLMMAAEDKRPAEEPPKRQEKGVRINVAAQD